MKEAMKETPGYTLYHPRWYRRRVSTYWWSRQWSYFKFILRELSSLSVAYFVALLLVQLRALSRGAEAYAVFQEWLKSPLALALNGVAFSFILYHAITWFNLAPRAMSLRLGRKRVPDLMISGPNYVLWAVISGGVAWLLLGGK